MDHGMTSDAAPVTLKFDGGNRIAIEIDGRRRVLDIESDASIGGDLEEEMLAIPGLLAWYHRVLAVAGAHLDTVDAGYRAWQAAQQNDVLGEDPKTSEWKVRGLLASNPQFASWKSKQALATELVRRLAGAVTALEVKANVLLAIAQGRAPKRMDAEERQRQLIERGLRTEE